ncbi:unnamed protein product, partial [Brachionus calyciflorus]
MSSLANTKTIDKNKIKTSRIYTAFTSLSTPKHENISHIKRQTTDIPDGLQDISSASSVTSHYQVITICNTLPSILKCQNRQHFLILHRVTYGISDWTSENECILKSKCLEMNKNDEFNCTGSNICVFYPNERSLNSCQTIKSNLTQIQIACVSLTNLKKYLINNKNLIQMEYNTDLFDLTKTTSTNSINTTTYDMDKKFKNESGFFNFNISTIRPYHKVFTFATPITFINNSNS